MRLAEAVPGRMVGQSEFRLHHIVVEGLDGVEVAEAVVTVVHYRISIGGYSMRRQETALRSRTGSRVGLRLMEEDAREGCHFEVIADVVSEVEGEGAHSMRAATARSSEVLQKVLVAAEVREEVLARPEAGLEEAVN